MSILHAPEPLINPAEAAELVRVGHTGDAPAEPVRLTDRAKSPSQADELAQCTAMKLAGPRESISPYMVGAYRSLYGELYQHYLDARAELQRARTELAFWPERAAELADAVSYGTDVYNS